MADRNARFWVHVNGDWARLTLRPNESRSWSQFRRTDEGWQRTSEEWTHEGDRVRVEWSTEARDCDGRYDMGGAAACLLGDLAARDMFELCNASENRGIMAPDWQHFRAEQRDHTAEAAGY